MLPKLIQHQSCTRREFVLASGLAVVGSLVSCGQGVEQKKTVISVNQANIRVRIGKNVKSVRVGKNIFTSKSLHDSAKTIELQPNTIIISNNQSKTISGNIVLYPKSNNTFDVIAHVPIEKYLPGVIAGELFAHWHPAAFAAQAVAARSYATHCGLERKNTSHFDVSDGPSSQMFLGDVTLKVAHRAVEETSGVVLSWNNRIIPSYYSSCCGGKAANALDAISSSEQHNIPPLRGHSGDDVCTSLERRTWTATRSARVLRKRLNACAKSMGIPILADIRTIRSIESIETNQHGRPTKLVVYGRRNEMCEVRARDFVRAANATVLSLPNTKEQIWSSFLKGEKIGSTLTIHGFGMGHGVGLCQYGAQELAGKGESWQKILAWYYPQVTIGG